jgi:hypothetical protein
MLVTPKPPQPGPSGRMTLSPSPVHPQYPDVTRETLDEYRRSFGVSVNPPIPFPRRR